MARNKVQFQKGLSEAEFLPTMVTRMRAARRFSAGAGLAASSVRRAASGAIRARPACADPVQHLPHSDALTAGTIFANTKLPLTTWFRAMYLITQSKQGISTVELGRRLGVRQTTAWAMKSKLTQVMLERDAKKLLDGRVEMDDAYLGGRRSDGETGRGAPGKTPFVAAVETTDDGKPKRVQLRRVTRFSKKAIKALAGRTLKPSARVVTDGLGCFHGLKGSIEAHNRLIVAQLGHAEKLPNSSRSTPCSAISRARLPEPIARSGSTPIAPSPNSNGVSIGAMISPP